MNERLGAVDPVGVVRNWIERVIIADNLCPPLRAEASKCTNGRGGIDWNILSQNVVITSLHERSHALAKAQASNQLWGYLRQSVTPDENPPMTRI